MALAQMNPWVGDIRGNAGRISHAMARARAADAQIALFPELAVTGYPPEDLVLRRAFIEANLRAVEDIAGSTTDMVAVIGFVDRDDDALYNAAAVCQHGTVLGVYRKHLLPNYGVFDERRYFRAGTEHLLIDTDAGVVGVVICEDAWEQDGPVIQQARAGAQVVLDINASPFQAGKQADREQMLCDLARAGRTAIVYLNTVGGQDELVFDGGSTAIAPDGTVVTRMPRFTEELSVIDVPLGDPRSPSDDPTIRWARATLAPTPGDKVGPPVSAPLEREQEVYEALTLALRDYARKNGFVDVVLGLSGGIDSSLTAAVCADALGPDHVLGVAMPSEFSSGHSIEDARTLADNLGIRFLEIPIKSPYHAYLHELEDAFGAGDFGLAEENLQARIRGNLLMFISNRFRHLVITTGNKSEAAVGYSTLYGDMAGGFALLKDVFKMDVYALARYRNAISKVIPERVLTKPPSAELRPDQKDEDSLPPYAVLDEILDAYIEEDQDPADIVARGFDRATVRQVIGLVDRSEYKRRQAPPGPKVSRKAFGKDRRLPISNAWGPLGGQAGSGEK